MLLFIPLLIIIIICICMCTCFHIHIAIAVDVVDQIGIRLNKHPRLMMMFAREKILTEAFVPLKFVLIMTLVLLAQLMLVVASSYFVDMNTWFGYKNSN